MLVSLTPVECEALVLGLVIPELFNAPAARADILWQLADILAGTARGLAALPREKSVAIALLPAVVELLANPLGGVVVPTRLGLVTRACNR